MAKRAILIVTGSELTRGETRDLNGPFLAANLAARGFRVEEISLLPDESDILEEAVRTAAERADLLVVSGGLGPTSDDCTVGVLGRVLGRRVVRDPGALAALAERARARGLREEELPANYWKQAEVLEGAEVLSNPVGLAPGMIAAGPRGPIVVLPGVPRELQAIFRELVLPRLLTRMDLEPPAVLRAKILGSPESAVEAKIQELGVDPARVEYGISARPGEILVRFASRDPKDAGSIEELRGKLAEAFGPGFVPLEESLADSGGLPAAWEHGRIVHELLLRSPATVAAAESCTGGLISKILTDHPGSSAYFLGSVVAYHDAAKRSLLRVQEGVLRAHGAVSAEVCRAMALGARERFGADYALAVTGIAGPGGATPEKPAGLVYIGLAGPGGSVEVARKNFWGSRENVRQLAAVHALEMLRRAIAARARRDDQTRSSTGT